MATLDADDANILDAETVNWRLIIYPILLVLIGVVGGFVYYYYLQNERDQLEDTARGALLQAKTPEALIAVADKYPHTDQATLALLSAADGYFAKNDFGSATKTYQRVLDAGDTDAELRDSAQVGLASTLEADHKIDDAISAYLTVARRGDKSPYAPFAYSSVARLYDERGDKDNERKILVEEAGLAVDSPFVKTAQQKLRALNPAQAPLTFNVPPATLPAANPPPNATASAPPVPTSAPAPVKPSISSH